MILEVKGLNKRFGGLAAVNELSFSIHEGEILGLVGPNGAGKTTVFNLISGFFRPDSGEIVFDHRNIVGLKPNEICSRGLARTFQVVQTFGHVSVIENVMIGAFCKENHVNTAREKAKEVIDFVGLTPKISATAKSLTLADKKRLELAKALATQPKLLLLDEVIAGLNSSEVDSVVNMVKKIRKSGISILIIEHVMRAVMSLTDKVIVINHGSKIAEGTPREVTTNQEVIEAYLGCDVDDAMVAE
jgi:branched-chain amino acid transport system ATP-binding protein